MNQKFPVDEWQKLPTPFYHYDAPLLRQTLQELVAQADATGGCVVHYAVKANAHPALLRIISGYGLGADCVSGGEIRRALEAGFPAGKVSFAGVGKADWEIDLALEAGIFALSAESVPELEVIDELAGRRGCVAPVSLRINPDIGAHTHAHITTGLAENKFGINLEQMDEVLQLVERKKHLAFKGLHFHIGSQLLDMSDYVALCNRVNDILEQLEKRHVRVENVNLGGGLGVDYEDPDAHPVPDFAKYFGVFRQHLRLRPYQTLHVEPGRAVVAQCGTLVSRVLYVKRGACKQFAILDAGMTDLIRPAFYQAYHKIQNVTSGLPAETYDVVGPICESSDVFAKAVELPGTRRGDLLAIRSAGAYGFAMASQYNCRALPHEYVWDPAE